MKESVRPLISIPFVKRVQVEGKKGRVISVAEKGNQKKLKLFLKIPLKEREEELSLM